MDEEEVTTLVQALKDNKKRLGLSWDVTPATVTTPSPLRVHFDGDDAAAPERPVENGLGVYPLVGDRVYVLLTADTNYAFSFMQPKMYEATMKLAGAQPSISFRNIPPVRKLELTWTARSTNPAIVQNLRMQINGDTTGVYNTNFMQQNNLTVTPNVMAAGTFWPIGVIGGASAAANNFGAGHVVIPGWNAPHKNINHVHHSHFYEAAASSWHQWGGGLYFAVAPYTRVDLFCDAGNLDINSEFTLTGVY